MRISDWSSDVCSSDLLHGSARPFGRQLIKAGNDKIGNTGPDSIVDAAGSGDLDRSPAHGAGRCKILGGIVAHIGEGRWRKTIFRHDRLKAPPVRLPIVPPPQAGDHKRVDAIGGNAEDRKSTRLNSSHKCATRMPSLAG